MPDETVKRDYYKSGLLWQEIPCRDDVPHGLWRTFHNNGQVESEKPYMQGKLHGVCRQWAWSGKLLGSYEMDHATGIQRSWYDNGPICLEFHTLDGKFTGRSRHWLADGTLDKDHYLVEGRTVSRQEYYTAAVSDPRFPDYSDADFAPVDLRGPEIERRKTELLVQILMARSNHQEVIVWLDKHELAQPITLGRFPDVATARMAAHQFYDAGANQVEALDIYANPLGHEFCDRLAVFLSTDPAIRQHIRSLCGQMQKQFDLAFSPENDCAESVFILVLD